MCILTTSELPVCKSEVVVYIAKSRKNVFAPNIMELTVVRSWALFLVFDMELKSSPDMTVESLSRKLFSESLVWIMWENMLLWRIGSSAGMWYANLPITTAFLPEKTI